MTTSFIIRLNGKGRKCFGVQWSMTFKKTASQAGKDLRDPKTPKKDRALIASDLSQAKRMK